MRIRLLVDISGTRNGEPWPGMGNIVDLPDDEARSMIAAEQAVPATGPAAKAPPAAERAIVPDGDVEQRAAAEAVAAVSTARERPLTTSTGPVPPRKGSTR